MIINEIELAWAAGFFDGEGCTCFWIQKNRFYNRKYGRIRVSIAQKDRFVLRRFLYAVNTGSISFSGGKYQFYADGLEKCQIILILLWKFLSPIKKNQYREKLKIFIDWRTE